MKHLILFSTFLCLVTCGGGATDSGGTNSEINGDLQGHRIFPVNNPWYKAIDSEAVDPNIDNLIAYIGLGTGLHSDFGADLSGETFGIPYVLVKGTRSCQCDV